MLSSPTTTGARVESPIKNVYLKLTAIDSGKYTLLVGMNGQKLV